MIVEAQTTWWSGWGGWTGWTATPPGNFFANDDTYTSSWAFVEWSVGENDTIIFSNPTFELTSAPTTGTVLLDETTWWFEYTWPDEFNWEVSFEYELCQSQHPIATLSLDKVYNDYDAIKNELTYDLNYSHTWWLLLNSFIVDKVPEGLCYNAVATSNNPSISFSLNNWVTWTSAIVSSNLCGITDIRFSLPSDYTSLDSWSWSLTIWFVRKDPSVALPLCNTASFSASNAESVEDEVCADLEWATAELWIEKVGRLASDDETNKVIYDIQYAMEWAPWFPIVTDSIPEWLCLDWVLTSQWVDTSMISYSDNNGLSRSPWLPDDFFTQYYHTQPDQSDLSAILADLFGDEETIDMPEDDELAAILADLFGDEETNQVPSEDDLSVILADLFGDEETIDMPEDEELAAILADLFGESNSAVDQVTTVWKCDVTDIRFIPTGSSWLLSLQFVVSDELIWEVCNTAEITAVNAESVESESCVVINESEPVCWDGLIEWNETCDDWPSMFDDDRWFGCFCAPWCQVSYCVDPGPTEHTCDWDVDIYILDEVCLFEGISVAYTVDWYELPWTLDWTLLDSSWEVPVANNSWEYSIASTLVKTEWDEVLSFTFTDVLWCEQTIEETISIIDCDDNEEDQEQTTRFWWGWWWRPRAIAPSRIIPEEPVEVTPPVVIPEPVIQVPETLVSTKLTVVQVVPTPTPGEILEEEVDEIEEEIVEDRIDTVMNLLEGISEESWWGNTDSFISLPDFLPNTWTDMLGIVYAQESWWWWVWSSDAWGSSLIKDDCPDVDFSPSFYDGTCGAPSPSCETATVTITIAAPLESCDPLVTIRRNEIDNDLLPLWATGALFMEFEIETWNNWAFVSDLVLWQTNEQWVFFDADHISNLHLYAWFYPSWTLLGSTAMNSASWWQVVLNMDQNLSSNQVLISANTIQNFYVLADITQDASYIDDLLYARIDDLSITNAALGNACLPNRFLPRMNNSKIFDAWSLYVWVSVNNAHTEDEKNVLGWEISERVATFDFHATQEDIVIEDMELTISWVDPQNSLQSITVYSSDQSTVIYGPTSVTSNVIILNNIDFTVPTNSWETIYVKVEAYPIGNNVSGTQLSWNQGWPYALSLSVDGNDAYGVISGDTMDNTNSTLNSMYGEDFYVTPVDISNVQFIQFSWNEVKANENWWLTTNSTVGILRITADNWSNTDMNGGDLDMHVQQITLDETLWAQTTVTQYELYKVWWTEAAYVWTVSWSQITFDTSWSSGDFFLEAGEIADYVIKATWVTTVAGVSDSVGVEIDDLSSWAIIFGADDTSIPWYSLIDDPRLWFDVVNNNPVFDND